MGHSMGGHGALVLFLRRPDLFKSVSAFAPIAHPTQCPWGEKAFSGYLGQSNREAWNQYDATELVKHYTGPLCPILVDQVSSQILRINMARKSSADQVFTIKKRFNC
jgi:S-formylglutathione hydrolase